MFTAIKARFSGISQLIERPSMRIWNGLLIAFLLAHIVFKFLALPVLEMQGDEAFSIFFAQQSVSELLETLNNEANPPLFYLLLHFWIKVFGIDPAAIKSLVILISLGTAYFIFRIGKQSGSLVFTFFISTCFLLSNLHFDFSHEVRAFELVLLLTAASVYTLTGYLQTGKLRWLFFLVPITSALPFTHYNAALVPVVEFLASLFFLRSETRRILILWGAWLVAALLFLPQVFVFLSVVPDENFWLGLATFEDLKYVHYKLLGNDPSFWTIMPVFYSLPIIVFAGKRLNWFKKDFSVKLFFLFWLLFPVPLFLNYWLAQHVPSFQVRYLLFAGLGIYFSIGYVFSHFDRFRMTGMLYLSLVLFQFVFEFSPTKREGEGWKETAEMVRSFKKRKVLVLINATYKARDLMYYYDRSAFSDFRHFGVRCIENGIVPVSGLDAVKKLGDLGNYEKVILILSHSDNEDPEHLIVKHLDSELDFCYEIGDYYRSMVRVYSTGKTPCAVLKELSSSKENVQAYGQWEHVQLKEELSGVLVDRFDLQFKGGKMTIDPALGFSPSRENETEGISIVESSLSFACDARPDARLVVSVEHNGNSLKRAEYHLGEYYDKGERAIEVRSGVMGDYPEGALVKVYVWNPGGPAITLETFSVSFWNK